MSNEKWQQVKEVFDAALRHKPEERSKFLDEVCAGDETVRLEVESLLSSFDHAETFMEKPVVGEMAEATTIKKNIFAKSQCLGHYEIIEQIGAGGMGEVYLARDTKLGRKVALKLLPSYFASDAGRLLRFEQEACAASSLNHPNILTIYETGEASGTHFIATEYIEGETLRQRITRGGLELLESLTVIMQVAEALSAAHAAGIIHRDVKPENIMIRPDGFVKVLDFGLVKLTEQQTADPEAASRAIVKTSSGVVMGTVNYMSPEQARGLGVDALTDIFSLGVVLYEMVTGRAPFNGETPSDVVAAILKTEPPPLADDGREVPRELEQVVSRALRKDREERYQAVKDFLLDLKGLRQKLEVRAKEITVTGTITVSDLRWRRRLSPRAGMAWAAVIVVVMAGLGSWLLWRGGAAGARPEIKSLAVLPLENLSGDPAQEYFADGMTEALISNLAQIRALDRVISRTSVMRYKGSGKSLPEIAAELKVDAVIEGTVQRAGGRVRVTTKLIPVATDSPVWAHDYDRDLSDVLKLQSEVARAVANEIRIQLTPEEQARLTSAQSIDPRAHDAYQLGRHHLRTNEEDLRQAIGHFELAIQLAPDYAAAYAGLSHAWAARGVFGAKTRKEAVSLARDAAMKAVALDSQLAEAHIALGAVKIHDWDWAGAEQEFARALELDPNSARAHQEYAELLMALERHDEANSEIARAAQLDPLSSNIQARYGRVLYRARRYEEAVPHLERAIELDPNPGNSMPYWVLGELYREMNRFDEALANFKKYESHGGRAPGVSVGIASVYARMGKQKEARQILAELKATTDPVSFSDAPLARAYAALGDKDEAFRVLFRQVEERNNVATFAKADPPFDSLRSDPRWKELLRRMNFPPE